MREAVNQSVIDSREPLAEMPIDSIETTLAANIHGPIHLLLGEKGYDDQEIRRRHTTERRL